MAASTKSRKAKVESPDEHESEDRQPRRIRVTARVFAAACTHAGKHDVRYYLNGVYIEPHPEGATLTATDGHRLIQILDRAGYANAPAICQLPDTVVRACLSSQKSKIAKLGVKTLYFSGDAAALWRKEIDLPNDSDELWSAALAPNTHCEQILYAPAVDGRYPDYWKVIKVARDGLEKDKARDMTRLTINPRYFSDMANAFAAAAGLPKSKNRWEVGTRVHATTPDDAVIVTSMDATTAPAFGLVMPMRDGLATPATVLPGWIAMPETAEKHNRRRP